MNQDNTKDLKDELLSDPFASSQAQDLPSLQPEQPDTAQDGNKSVLTTFKERFSEDDMKRIQDIKSKIEPLDNDALITYGSNAQQDRKSTRLNSSHVAISYAVFCLIK